MLHKLAIAKRLRSVLTFPCIAPSFAWLIAVWETLHMLIIIIAEGGILPALWVQH